MVTGQLGTKGTNHGGDKRDGPALTCPAQSSHGLARALGVHGVDADAVFPVLLQVFQQVGRDIAPQDLLEGHPGLVGYKIEEKRDGEGFPGG